MRTSATIGRCILSRPRHAELIAQVRETGARIRLISDGAGAIAVARPESGTDLLRWNAGRHHRRGRDALHGRSAASASGGPWGYIHAVKPEAALAELRVDSLREAATLFTPSDKGADLPGQSVVPPAGDWRRKVEP